MYSNSAQAVCIVCAKFDYMHLTNTATTVYKSEKIILRSLVSTLSNALFGTLISSHAQLLGFTALVRTSLFLIFAFLIWGGSPVRRGQQAQIEGTLDSIAPLNVTWLLATASMKFW